MLSPRGRKLKKINIALGCLVFLLAIAALIWFFVAPAPPSKEVIKSIEIKGVNAQLKNDEKPEEAPFTYTIIAIVQNPNQDFIAKEIDWTIGIKNENGETIIQERGTDELKGNEEKEIKKDIIIDKQGKTASFKITHVMWIKNDNTAQ